MLFAVRGKAANKASFYLRLRQPSAVLVFCFRFLIVLFIICICNQRGK